MKKEQNLLVIAGLGAIVGLVMTFQFKTEFPVESSVPIDELEAREELLKQFLDQQSYLQSRIVTLRGQINDMQQEIEDVTGTSNLTALDSLKKEIGLAEVSGEGLEIILGDSPLLNTNESTELDKYRVQASDLRDMVNLLNAASADAIAINGQRVIATTAISSVGTTILINNSHTAPPFSIVAIGDIELMLERILNRSLLPAIYEKHDGANLRFEIIKKSRVNVPIYNGNLNTEYINLVNE